MKLNFGGKKHFCARDFLLPEKNLSLGLHLYTCSRLEVNILPLKCLQSKRSGT